MEIGVYAKAISYTLASFLPACPWWCSSLVPTLFSRGTLPPFCLDACQGSSNIRKWTKLLTEFDMLQCGYKNPVFCVSLHLLFLASRLACLGHLFNQQNML